MNQQKIQSTLTINGTSLDCASVIVPKGVTLRDGTTYYEVIRMTVLLTKEEYATVPKKKVTGTLNHNSIVVDGEIAFNDSVSIQDDNVSVYVFMLRTEENIKAFEE